MPQLDSHTFWSERATGLRCEATHRLIDSWSSVLGSHHRVFFHDPMSAMMAADVIEGPECRAAALNHILVDQVYNEPSTKIVMEMIRLTETAPHEGQPAPFYTNYGRCRVRHFSRS